MTRMIRNKSARLSILAIMASAAAAAGSAVLPATTAMAAPSAEVRMAPVADDTDEVIHPERILEDGLRSE